MVDITFNGLTMEFHVVESKMDPDLKTALLKAMPDAAEQELLDAYLVAHKARFGEDFLQF